MCPMLQIIPPDRDKGQKEATVRTVDMPQVTLTEEERTREAMRRQQEAREAERYGTLVARPLPQESIMVTESTRRRMAEREQEKDEVPNVVTTHSDVAKVAKGADATLVPTVNVYTKADPTEEKAKMEVEDPTIRPVSSATSGSIPETVLDRAETSLAQPQGDEYSERSATGPTLPEGHAANPEKAKQTTPAFKPDADRSERHEQIQENADEASQAAQKEIEKADAEVAKEATKAEAQGASGVAGTKSTDEDSGSPAAKSDSGAKSKSTSRKGSTRKGSKGKGK